MVKNVTFLQKHQVCPYPKHVLQQLLPCLLRGWLVFAFAGLLLSRPWYYDKQGSTLSLILPSPCFVQCNLRQTCNLKNTSAKDLNSRTPCADLSLFPWSLSSPSRFSFQTGVACVAGRHVDFLALPPTLYHWNLRGPPQCHPPQEIAGLMIRDY